MWLRERERARASAYLLGDWDLVVVADTIFTQEVKLHHPVIPLQVVVEGEVLHPERAAAYRVGRLSFLLLITRSQSQLGHTHRINSSNYHWSL